MTETTLWGYRWRDAMTEWRKMVAAYQSLSVEMRRCITMDEFQRESEFEKMLNSLSQKESR